MHWHRLTHETPSDLPPDGEDIFCCITEGEDTSFTPVYRMRADIAALQDLLSLYPDWQIYWQPASDPSPAQPSMRMRKERHLMSLTKQKLLSAAVPAAIILSGALLAGCALVLLRRHTAPSKGV